MPTSCKITGPERAINFLIHFVTPAGFGWATSLAHVAATVAPFISDQRTGGRPRRGLKCTASASLVLFSSFFIFSTPLDLSKKKKNHHQASFLCNLPVCHCSVLPAHQPHTPKPKPKMVSPSCPGHPFLDGVNKGLWLVATLIILICDARHYYRTRRSGVGTLTY
ncbi:hypothetical protein QL093DRAFT_2354106 [Fusarium oxysporum]|nr:hypothetical protein QL093DRAFT_2354106 [Fusarium oxysporum]